MECYSLREVNCESALLPWTNITTYVITMEDSVRDFSPLTRITPRTLVLENKGFKRCAKKGVTSPARDLLHANEKIFQLEETNANPVLVLEDDCQILAWDAALFEACIATASAADVDAVSLGCKPLLCSRHSNGFCRVHLGAKTHAVLYSKRGRQRMQSLIREAPYTDHLPHDRFLYIKLRVVAPRRALAGQIQDVATENHKYWGAHAFSEAFDREAEVCAVDVYACYKHLHDLMDVTVTNNVRNVMLRCAFSMDWTVDLRLKQQAKKYERAWSRSF